MTEEEYVLGIIEAIRHNERRKTIEEVIEVTSKISPVGQFWTPIEIAMYLQDHFLKAEK